MNNLLATIQAALRPGSLPDSLEGNEPGANASITEPLQPGATQHEVQMSIPSAQPGAASANAELIATLAAASTGGKAEGYKMAADRFAAVLSAEGVKGDGKRMAAALDLAISSPDMAAETVTAFVTSNVPAAAASGPAPDANGYEQRRLAAAGLAQPQAGGGSPAPKVAIDRGAIFSARRAHNGKGA